MSDSAQQTHHSKLKTDNSKLTTSRSYRDLTVWRKSIAMVKSVYIYTREFPKDEIYGIVSQMRRAAVSVASNIAEGQGRNSSGEFRQFLGNSRGSLYELETQLIISQEVGYITEQELENLLNACEEIGRMLFSLIKSLE